MVSTKPLYTGPLPPSGICGSDDKAPLTSDRGEDSCFTGDSFTDDEGSSTGIGFFESVVKLRIPILLLIACEGGNEVYKGINSDENSLS